MSALARPLTLPELAAVDTWWDALRADDQKQNPHLYRPERSPLEAPPLSDCILLWHVADAVPKYTFANGGSGLWRFHSGGCEPQWTRSASLVRHVGEAASCRADSERRAGAWRAVVGPSYADRYFVVEVGARSYTRYETLDVQRGALPTGPHDATKSPVFALCAYLEQHGHRCRQFGCRRFATLLFLQHGGFAEAGACKEHAAEIGVKRNQTHSPHPQAGLVEAVEAHFAHCTPAPSL